MNYPSVDPSRLLGRLRELGSLGRDEEGRLSRLTGTDADRAGRDCLVSWLENAGLSVAVDRIGNIFGIWKPAQCDHEAPLMLGSHIDTVINAGIYDGSYGVLAALEVIETIKELGTVPKRPIVVAAFTNEEGVRFAPVTMGSLVYSGGLSVEAALATVGTDGKLLGRELERIGYAGERGPGFIKPHAYVELHVEQGPILENEGVDVGAVTAIQGVSWQRVTIVGEANHAGTTPIAMRRDAGLAAARAVTYLRERARGSGRPIVATVGCMQFEPNAINVIPSKAVFTVDMRSPDRDLLAAEEVEFAGFLERLAEEENVRMSTEKLVRFEPVSFDAGMVSEIEDAASRRGLSSMRMTSGASHDAQMMAKLCPAAMIFAPSVRGVSHNPSEFTADAHIVACANVLLDVARRIVT